MLSEFFTTYMHILNMLIISRPSKHGTRYQHCEITLDSSKVIEEGVYFFLLMVTPNFNALNLHIHNLHEIPNGAGVGITWNYDLVLL